MEDTFKVKCPCCESILVIRRRDGELLEHREPIARESTGDRFKDAYQKVKKRSEEVDGKVSEVKRKEEERLKGADDFFKEALERAKKTKDEKPTNPLDWS